MLKCWIYFFISALCVYVKFEYVSGKGNCKSGAYGLNCNHTCHCNVNNCDDVTGCNGGPNSCKSGWSGPMCTIENVALGKTTKQSSYNKEYHNSSLAVDGNLTQGKWAKYCILTNPGQPYTWWQVDLGTEYYVQNITVHFRSDYKVRMKGVKIYACQSEKWSDGCLCYRVKLADPVIKHVTCDTTARYVTLYRSKKKKSINTAMDFCEVQVFACDSHFYGSRCTQDCSERHCNGKSTCNSVGKCDNGCAPGYVSTDCKKECSSDKYGLNCSKLCKERKCFGDSICDHVKGTCVDGCQRGYESTDCTTSCNGKYGYNCNMSCVDRHCTGRQDCDTENGTCIDGCVAGWEQSDCTVKCRHDTYGSNCEYKCSERHCTDNNSKCDAQNGKCQNGCQPGWKNPSCNEKCNQGTYGEKCLKKCEDRHCLSSENCHHQSGLCVDGCLSGWEGETCTQTSSEQSKVRGGLVTGVVAVVIVVIIVAVVVIVIFRKRRKNEKDTDDIPITELPKILQRSRRQKKDEFVYENVNPTKNDVSQLKSSVIVDVVEFPDTEEEEMLDEDINPYYNDVGEVRTFCLPEDGFDVLELESIIECIRSQRGGFEAEFLKLPSGFKHPYTVSQIPENRKKNRFAGYYPYDNNRVKLTTLPDIPHSDYINASYVDGYDKKNYFIASQAPNKVTLPDFWRMIWEQDCGQIVMLTNLIEEGKQKCEQYWNDDSVLTVEFFDVVVTKVNVRANYTNRKIQVTHKKTRKTKTFHHFHFTSWHDHGVPKAVDILDFFWLTKETPHPRPGPVLVHCSAGIGRTGTYIALHILTDEMKTGRINILGVMTRLREQRKNMVQTHRQYEHIFNVMVEIVKYGLTIMSVSDYVERYSRKKSSLLMGKKTVRQLAQIIATTDTSPTGKLLNNRLWVDGREDLFVVSAPSSLLKTGYLLVYRPNRTENLLWKLITEHDSLTLIILGHQSNVSFVPPLSQSRIHGSITITTINETNITKEITLRTMKLESKESPNKKEVVSFWVQSWTSARDTSAAMRYLITLAEHLMDRQTKLKFHPITVVFDESEKKQGVSLCILNNIMSSVFTDKRVEIFNNVRRLQTVLPNIHISEDDFLFFCSIPFGHLESSGIYANISITKEEVEQPVL